MKILITLSWILWMTMSGNAQTVTIGHESVPVEYYRLPDQPLPASYSTYTPDISIPFHELSKTGMNESNLIDQYLRLEGYKKVSVGGDVAIEVGISEFNIWGETRNTKRTKSKDKEGNEQIKYSYSLEVKYSLPMSLRVSDKQGSTLLDRRIYSMSDTRIWTSNTYNSISELDNYWRYNRVSRLNELHKNLLTEGLNQVFSLINSEFGYRRIDDKVRFEAIGKKSHPEYDVFQQNVELIKSAFTLMSADKSLDAVKAKVKPALTFYSTENNKYKATDKNEKRLKHICLYNLGLAYLWLEDFEQATLQARALQNLDPKDKDAKKLLEEIEYVQYSLQKSDRASRHMIVVGSKT